MASGRSRLTSSAVALAGIVVVLLGGERRSAIDAADRTPPVGVDWPSTSDLDDGDLVFRTGRGVLTRLVLSQGGAPRFSHVGVVVKLEGRVFVVHAVPPDDAVPGGVVLEPLTRFASAANAADVGFYRVKTVQNDSRATIRQYVLGQVGKPFDDAFALSDDGRMYCTELVLKALATAGIDIAGTVRHIRVMLLAEPVVSPDDLRLSPLVEPSGVTYGTLDARTT